MSVWSAADLVYASESHISGVSATAFLHLCNLALPDGVDRDGAMWHVRRKLTGAPVAAQPAEETMKKAEKELRRAIVEQSRWMNASGLNQGTSGNISVRFGRRMLITPSATPYDQMEPEMIAALALNGDGAWDGPLKPSTEWRFHLDILRARPDVHAVVHAHPTFCTALAMCRKAIPAAHYMVAAFGGADVRCSDYATFGTEALSATALAALAGRSACLLANHGMIALGESLDKAMWRAVELETLARQYWHTLAIGGPVLLSDDQITETTRRFDGYGRPEEQPKRGRKGAR